MGMRLSIQISLSRNQSQGLPSTSWWTDIDNNIFGWRIPFVWEWRGFFTLPRRADMVQSFRTLHSSLLQFLFPLYMLILNHETVIHHGVSTHYRYLLRMQKLSMFIPQNLVSSPEWRRSIVLACSGVSSPGRLSSRDFCKGGRIIHA